MENGFYDDFDLERFPSPDYAQGEYRTPFQIERDRIVFSYPFRKLQSKTQVFQSGEYDFYRTRLTHTIEVAKIGRSICDFLRVAGSELRDDFYIDPDLTEAVGLAHDLGHPPFGHIGERKLNELMQAHGGFEGNGQTLRILSELIYDRPEGTSGMNPTRAFLDGVMKYKCLYSDALRKGADGKTIYPENHFIYDDQVEMRARAFGQEDLPPELTDAEKLNACKSIECQIMDWADDTAYSVNDIVDGIHARYITLGSLEGWMAAQSNLSGHAQRRCEWLIGAIRDGSFERRLSARIGHCIRAVSLERQGGYLAERTHRHAYRLVVNPEIFEEVALFKQVAVDLIFKSPQIQQIEFKGGFVLNRLFNAFADCYGNPHTPPSLHMLPPAIEQLVLREETESGRYRRLCDCVAALTDGQATRTYKRLFDPEFGSITELF